MLKVPGRTVGLVLGQGGETLRQMQIQSEADIQVSKGVRSMMMNSSGVMPAVLRPRETPRHAGAHGIVAGRTAFGQEHSRAADRSVEGGLHRGPSQSVPSRYRNFGCPSMI